MILLIILKKLGVKMKSKKIIIIGGTGALGKTLIKKYYQQNTIIIFSRDQGK